MCRVHQASSWCPGHNCLARRQKGGERNITLSVGTAIDAFINGKYHNIEAWPSMLRSFSGKPPEGILVLDQSKKPGNVQPRAIYWAPRSPGASNDGNAFSVIEW